MPLLAFAAAKVVEQPLIMYTYIENAFDNTLEIGILSMQEVMADAK